MSILVLGTVALDTVKTPSGFKKDLLGGSAVHFSMAARLFTDVHLVANVGEDFPRKHLAFLSAKGIHIDSLMRDKGKTFRWQGAYEGDLNAATTLDTQLGVLSSFKPCISSTQSGMRHVFLANVDPAIQQYLLSRMRKPLFVGLDSMNYWIAHKRNALIKVLKNVDLYVANDQEARTLSGEINLVKAARALRALGPRLVLIKKGEHGVLLAGEDFIFCLPAFPVEKVVDPTGAGDSFAGGFMGYVASQKTMRAQTLKQAVAFGTICASFNVQGFGVAVTAGLTLAKIRKRLQVFKRSVAL
ncbi:MAG: sugar kinase [Candidatus Omnitrophica bacterium]|nr:sugar kinase [Candidatus Omnitrophota bacterium]